MKNVNKLLKAAEKPSKLARKLHPYYKGKIEILPKCRVKSFDDFAVWYSPGVAAVCKDIYANPELVYEFTNKWNTIAIVSDGTRVLGLGNIGPEAGLPVMEGKALLFKYLGAVDAFPICLDTKDQDKIIETVKILQPSFGGINLEDIEQPKCFPILNRLRKECRIPVWHDDQQGTALVTLAGFINALKLAKKKISSVKITLVGAGAANIRIASLLMKFGADPLKIVMTDSEGTLHRGRTELKSGYHEKWEMCRITNGQNIVGGTAEALENADAVIALSAPGPGVIKKEWIKKMAPNPIVFVCANPVPEIWPWEAKEAGAFIVATGRSDFPNQVNNVLAFPGIFRGALDIKAKQITEDMKLAASKALAGFVKKPTEDKILPLPFEKGVADAVANAVKKAYKAEK